MSFEAVKADRGQPMVRGTCDHCGRKETVRAETGKKVSEGFGQAAAKLQHMGWTYIGKSLRCPTCEAKRKVKGMATATKQKPPVAGAPPVRQPTQAQRREIIITLSEFYDSDAGRYIGDATDEALAELLGVMPGWVAREREDLFGGSGANEDMASLQAEVSKFISSSTVILGKLEDMRDALKAEISAARDYEARIAKIEKAVGPRIIARAK